jgi:hypothetical protein
MENLAVKDINEYKNIVSEFKDYEKTLKTILHKVITEVAEKHPSCKNGLLIPVTSKGVVEFYFKEYVDSLLVCSVNIFDLVVIGSKMEEGDRKRYLGMMYEKRDFIQQEEKQAIKSRKFRKDWLILTEKKKAYFDNLMESLAITKVQMDDYIRFLEEREDIMIEITNDIIEILNESDELNFLRFSKLYEYIKIPFVG